MLLDRDVSLKLLGLEEVLANQEQLIFKKLQVTARGLNN